MSTQQPLDEERRRHLGLGGSKRRRWVWRGVFLFLVLAIAFGASRYAAKRDESKAPRYRTVPAKVDGLKVTVTATGAVKGLDTVDVGAQISGRVVDVFVDFNDRVKKGTLLARIDTEPLQARVDESRAQLLVSQAALRNAEATELEASQKLARTEQLVGKGLLPKQDLETVAASQARSKASIESARAQQTAAQAGLRNALLSLGNAEIRAPINGIVLSRAVEPGQTVAASFQAPVLFTLAKDLARLKLHVDIDEADVGRVREGQRATFTVEAYPDRTFESTVLSVRNVPKASTTVVAYEAVLTVDNSEGLLRPGMTATSTIVSDSRDNVLVVPNAALRFRPASPRGGPPMGIPGLSMGGGRPREGAMQGNARKGPVVWVLREVDGISKPVPLSVQTGATDGRVTEVTGGELEADTEVIVDLATGSES